MLRLSMTFSPGPGSMFYVLKLTVTLGTLTTRG